jgi:hypothetical protein
MYKKFFKILFSFSLTMALIHGIKAPLYAAEKPGHLLISGGYGYSMPLGGLSDMMESSMPFRASIRYVTNKGSSIGLAYANGDYESEEVSDRKFMMEKVLIQYGGLQHWSKTDFNFQVGLGYINFKTNDGYEDGTIMFGGGLGVDFYLTDWLSVGPKIDLSYFEKVKSHRYYWVGDPQSGGYIESYPHEYESCYLLDIFLAFTLHLF